MDRKSDSGCIQLEAIQVTKAFDPETYSAESKELLDPQISKASIADVASDYSAFDGPPCPSQAGKLGKQSARAGCDESTDGVCTC